jgi:hypothetical protein
MGSYSVASCVLAIEDMILESNLDVILETGARIERFSDVTSMDVKSTIRCHHRQLILLADSNIVGQALLNSNQSAQETIERIEDERASQRVEFQRQHKEFVDRIEREKKVAEAERRELEAKEQERLNQIENKIQWID